MRNPIKKAMWVCLLAGLTVPMPSNAQSEFPLTGRWGYFDYGTRSVDPVELDRACTSAWDSFAPDGAFVGFEMDERGVVAALFGGFCVAFGREITCHYLLDYDPAAEDDTDHGEVTFAGSDFVDYVLYGENGKLSEDDRWTYVRCPASAGFSVG